MAMTTASFNAGGQLVRDIWAISAISIITTTLRTAAKIRIRQFRWDDVFLIIGECFALTGSAIMTVGVHKGFGRHVWDVPPSEVSTIVLFDYLTQSFGLAASCLGRVGCIIYVVNLLGSKRTHKMILWVTAALQVATNVISIIILFLQCPGHGSAIWNEPGKQKCWNVHVQAYYAYFLGSFNSATDLLLAALPVYTFWHLNVKLHVKIGLMILLGLGIFAMSASIIRTVTYRVLDSSDDDPTAATVTMDRWLYIETHLVLITSSIPCIRSLFTWGRRGKPSTRSGTYELGSRCGGESVHAYVDRSTAYRIESHDVINDDTGSEENILKSDGRNGFSSRGSGIVKRVDITVSVDPKSN